MGAAVSSVELIAPAKLTLSLRITGVRSDGYHLIDAEMVSVALSDTVRIAESSNTSLHISGPFAEGVPNDASNIALRALALANRTAAVEIVKNIPHGGGLGGGSTDAATVLRWAGYTDLDSASRIGADVPFCMVGGRARVRGIGEIVEPLPSNSHTLPLTLIVPPLQVSTPVVYKAWDDLGGPTSDGVNDLEPAACAAYPDLGRWRSQIKALGLEPILAGSGATWFVHGHFKDIAKALPDARVYFTETLA